MNARRFTCLLAIGVVFVLLIALATSCSSEPPLTSGRVLDMHYDDPDRYYDDGPCIWVSTDAKGGGYCSYPFGHYECCTPAHWSIQVRGRDHEGNEHTQWITVTEAEYARIKVGQSWEATS